MRKPEQAPREREEDGTPEKLTDIEKDTEIAEPELEEIREYFKQRLLEEGSLRARGEEGAKEEMESIHSSLEKLDRASPEDLESILSSFSNSIESLKNSTETMEGIDKNKTQDMREDIGETEDLIGRKRHLEKNLLEALQKRDSTKEIVHEDIIKFLQNPEEFDQKYKEEGEDETEISKLSSEFQDNGAEGIEQVLNAVNRRIEEINEGEGGDISEQAPRREHLRDLRNYLTEEFFSKMPEFLEQKEQEELQKVRQEAKKIFEEEESEKGSEKEV